ncbi:hypothetical protein ACFU53_04915 [Streptomyces sp. NPDC057474]|uniref:hypothetical protein n=1 Tax=Streptomyces sp. NPDC057474 TaxID=3346144 RepID=UPI00367A56F0
MTSVASASGSWASKAWSTPGLPKESSASLHRKAAELDVRLRKRLALLDQQQLMSTKPPQILTAALC